MAVTPGRGAALSALRAVGRGRRLDLAIAQATAGLDDRERRFARELAYGTMRLRGRIDWLLAAALDRPLDRVDALTLDVLRLGAYQILYLDAPDYAAVSQAVELAPARARGLVNAVLRAVSRAGADAARFPSPDADPGAWLAAWGSHPRWLVDRWLARWPLADVRALVARDNEIPALTLLPLEHDPEEAVARLGAAGVPARAVGEGTRCVRLDVPSDLTAALAALPAIVQDPGASLVVDYGVGGPAPAASDRAARPWAADLCAAPGGKALALAARGYRVLAADRSPVRLRRVGANAARTAARVWPVAGLAERPPLAAAPLVLLDVPCTGTGTLGRHPDARWRLAPGDPAGLAAVQERILEGGAAAVEPGGLLVYSTCTLEPEENEERIDVFLERHPEFTLEPTAAVGAPHVDGAGRLAVRPWTGGFDGAFAARLRRTGRAGKARA